MRTLLLALVTAMLIASSASAQFSQPIEGFLPGSLGGQGGWIASSGSTDITVDNMVFSPLDGSTQSVRFRGNGAGEAVDYALPQTINTGVWNFSYDLNITNRTTSNLIIAVGIRNGTTNIFEPYAQDGGAGIAQNGFYDSDGLGGTGFFGHGDLFGDPFRYQANRWYRFSFTMNFDSATIYNMASYDISSGTALLVDSTAATYYFNNNGTSYVRNFDTLHLVLGSATSAEGANLDNIRIVAAPELSSVALLAVGGLVSIVTVRRRKTAG